MMFESGRVVAVEADSLWVETIRQSTCGTCAAQKGCGHSLLNKISDGKRGYVRVLSGRVDSSECVVDDEVRFSIPEEVILRGSLIVYMVPLVCMLLGAASAAYYLPGSEDLAALAGASVGVGLGVGVVRWHARRHSQDPGLQPSLEEILMPAPTARPVILS
jgi:sigma-E factor negative regulatory protein RseC